jgi:hypothetical protein
MNCKNAQQLLEDLAKNRLPNSLSCEVRRHLEDCTDCRVLEQRAARLQRLLALKRHERPAPEYFKNFLAEFHGRLEAQAGQASLWSRLVAQAASDLRTEPVPIWRYAFAGAAAVTLAIGLMWLGVRQAGQPATMASAPIVVTPPPAILADGSVSAPPVPGSSEIFTKDELTLVPATERPVPSLPRYVLDRVTIVPASYEVANNVQF